MESVFSVRWKMRENIHARRERFITVHPQDEAQGGALPPACHQGGQVKGRRLFMTNHAIAFRSRGLSRGAPVFAGNQFFLCVLRACLSGRQV